MPKIVAVSVYVDDMEQAVEFYTKHLGFQVAARPAPPIVKLEHDGAALVLLQAERRRPIAYSEEAGTVIGIATSDAMAAAAKLRAAGVELLVSSPQQFPGGQFIAVRDPAGNAIELLEFAGK